MLGAQVEVHVLRLWFSDTHLAACSRTGHPSQPRERIDYLWYGSPGSVTPLAATIAVSGPEGRW
jgi:hypothetical protein